MRCLNTPSARASESPDRATSAALRGRARGRTSDTERADVADPRPGRHAGDVGDGQQLGRRAVQAGAGRADPDADRHRRIGDAVQQRRDHVVAHDRTAASRPAGPAPGCPGRRHARSRRRSRRRRSSSNSPLTCSTSTGGPGAGCRRWACCRRSWPSPVWAVAGEATRPSRAMAPSRAISSLRTRCLRRTVSNVTPLPTSPLRTS